MAPESPRRDRKDIAVGVENVHIDAAREEWKSIGARAFHRKYGTRAAAKFLIRDPDGTEYDAKAVLFAARKIAGLDGANADFDGDTATIRAPLVDLGYTVREISPTSPSRAGRDYWWTNRPGENIWMEITRRPDIGGDLKAPARETTEFGAGADHAGCWYERARLETATRNFSEGKMCIEKSIELKPKDPYSQAERAFIGYHLGERTNEILARLASALELAESEGIPGVEDYIAHIKAACHITD